MASSFLRLKTVLPFKSLLLEPAKNPASCFKAGCRNLMSIAINNETSFQDVMPISERRCLEKPTLNLTELKQKEKRDWRFLTMEEKRALYQMSFNNENVYTETAPADEWKPILAGTFIAMGLMTMGIYFWFTQSLYHELQRHLSVEKSPLDTEPMMLMGMMFDREVKDTLEKTRH